MTTSSQVDREWTAAGYVVTWHGGWPAGGWQLKAGRVRGLEGRDGEDYDRADVAGNAIAVARADQKSITGLLSPARRCPSTGLLSQLSTRSFR